MAYHFERNAATVEQGVRRIATELIDDAIAAAKRNRNTDKTVHNLRMACKKLRGLIRLVRPEFTDYRSENAAFRDAARYLSGLRDGAVLIQIYDGLLEICDDQVNRSRFAPIRCRLALRHKELSKRDSVGARLRQFERDMNAARKRARYWRLGADGFDAMQGGIAGSYKDAKRAMIEASRRPTDDAVHEWRKRIKDHWYHARLLSPMCPQLMKAHRDVARDLAESLGQHHDLDLFRQRLTHEEIADASDLEALTRLIRRRQKALEDKAFLLGARLLTERPGDLTARWQSWWETWHSDRPRDAALAA